MLVSTGKKKKTQWKTLDTYTTPSKSNKAKTKKMLMSSGMTRKTQLTTLDTYTTPPKPNKTKTRKMLMSSGMTRKTQWATLDMYTTPPKPNKVKTKKMLMSRGMTRKTQWTTFDMYMAPPKTKQLHNPNGTVFFLENDIKSGHKMSFHFTYSSHRPSFLPPQLANSFPFSSSKLDDILARYDIKPGTEDAEIMKRTLKECEAEEIRGEEKHCATSFESMLNFVTSKLGTKVEAVSTEKVKDTRQRECTIAAGVEKVGEEQMVVCHRKEYPYAVFYCHTIENTWIYKMPLERDDGVIANAFAICHADMSQWNPKHLAFQMLRVKPGTVPVCHILPPKDHIVWLPKRLEVETH